MRIGQFADGYTPVADGVVTVIKNYAYWLNAKHGECLIYAPKTPGYSNPDPHVKEFMSLPVPGRAPYRAGLPNIDYVHQQNLRDMRFDIVHAHAPFGAGSNAMHVARRQGIPFVASFHSKYYDDFLQYTGSEMLAKLGSQIVASFYKKADSVWTVNKATADTLWDYGYHGKVIVMPNGTDFSYPADPQPLRERAGKLCSVDDETPLFVFVGQHDWKKNIRHIVEALALLKRERDFRFVFIGEGYAREDIETLVSELGMADKVKFLGLVKDRKDLQAIYCRAEALVFPSIYDNAPLVVRESAAMRCPSVLVEGASAAENVVDGMNGYLCQDTPQSICDSMTHIIDNPADVARVGRNASESIAVSWERIVDDVYDMYCEIIEQYRMEHGFPSTEVG